MGQKAVLSTVYETSLEKDPLGIEKPRILIMMSDGKIARCANEFGKRYKQLYSGSTIISIIKNGTTVSIARVDKFNGKSLRPSKVTSVLGPNINLRNLPDIKDVRWHTFRGNPIKQIPKPWDIKCPNLSIFS